MISISVPFPRNAARRLPVASLLLSLAALVIFFIPPLPAFLQYDRDALAAGQLWRALTCHWTHWTPDHLTWDLLTFAALANACELRSRPRCLVALALSAFAIPVCLYLFHPHLQTYRGLSGLDSALFALLAFDLTADRRARPFIMPLLAAFAAKLLYECLTHRTLFVTPGATPPMPLAHLIGAACGAVVSVHRPVPASPSNVTAPN